MDKNTTLQLTSPIIQEEYAEVEWFSAFPDGSEEYAIFFINSSKTNKKPANFQDVREEAQKQLKNQSPEAFSNVKIKVRTHTEGYLYRCNYAAEDFSFVKNISNINTACSVEIAALEKLIKSYKKELHMMTQRRVALVFAVFFVVAIVPCFFPHASRFRLLKLCELIGALGCAGSALAFLIAEFRFRRQR